MVFGALGPIGGLIPGLNQIPGIGGPPGLGGLIPGLDRKSVV
jgi:hypothetical protein